MLVIRLKAPIFSIGTYCEVKELRGQPLFLEGVFSIRVEWTITIGFRIILFALFRVVERHRNQSGLAHFDKADHHDGDNVARCD